MLELWTDKEREKQHDNAKGSARTMQGPIAEKVVIRNRRTRYMSSSNLEMLHKSKCVGARLTSALLKAVKVTCMYL